MRGPQIFTQLRKFDQVARLVETTQLPNETFSLEHFFSRDGLNKSFLDFSCLLNSSPKCLNLLERALGETSRDKLNQIL